MSRYENFSKFLPEVFKISRFSENGFLLRDSDSGVTVRVQLLEKIPYTQIAWRCISGWPNSGGITLSLLRAMPHRACRINFE